MAGLDDAQISGLGRDARRTEILRAKAQNALDARVATNTARLANLPDFIQSGAITVSASGTATATATITFPTAFASPPIFVCNLRGSGGFYVVTAGTTTATQAPVIVFRTDGANVTVDRTVHWVAVGTA